MIRRSMLLTALTCAAVFPSCQNTMGIARQPADQLPDAQRVEKIEDWYFKGGGYGGSSEIDDIGETLDGYSLGGRLEVGRILDPGTGHFELGGRFSIGGTWVDGSRLLIPSRRLDYSSIDFYIEPVVRGYLTTSDVRPYIEGFAGYGYSNIEVDGFVVDEIEDNGDGLTYGGGVGVEFLLTSGLSGPLTLAVGLEWRETQLDTGDFGDVDREDILGTFMLGTRW